MLTLFGWVLFRCASLADISDIAWQLTTDMRWTNSVWYFAPPVIASFLLLQSLHFWQMKADDEFVLLRLPLPQRISAFVFLLVSTATIGFRPTTFLYFQF